MNKHVLAAAVGAALLGTGVASAAPFNSFDPRSMAMGGAGAAVGNTATAPFFNPSLLSVTNAEDDFAIELPIVGVRAYDPDEFIDSVDNFQNDDTLVFNDELVITTSTDNVVQAFDAISNLDRANYAAGAAGDLAYVNAVRAAAANAAAALGTNTAQGSGTLTGDAKTLSTGFQTLSDRSINAEIGVGSVIGIPSKSFGGALVMNSWNVGSAIIRYRDDALLNGLADDTATFGTALDGVATCNTVASCEAALVPPADLNYIDTDTNGNLVLNFDPDTDIESSVEVRGLSLNEVGVALAREFTIGGQQIALGITPKYVKATTLNYIADVNSADQGDWEADDYTNETSNFNLDVGASKDFTNGWRVGMVVKNLIAQKYDMKVLNPATGVKEKTGEIELNPQARAGVSYQNTWFTGGLDVDLTENEAVGFEDNTRYVAMGIELDALDWAQLRLGYRADVVNSDRSVASAGLGLSPFGVHFDLAVAANENELGASAQFGFRF